MENIFENAYFGKAYKTRDGRKAIYLKCSKEIHHLILEDSSIIWIKNDGKAYSGILENSCYDIVSEWKKHIDEEELDKLAENHCYISNIGEPILDSHSLKKGFKAGYRKALNL